MVDVRVLGGVRTGDGETIGSAQQRRLLTRLVARRPAVVDRDELTRLLWPTSPPASATQVLHTQIHRLRILLEPDRSVEEAWRVITSVPTRNGYRLGDRAIVDADVAVATLDRAGLYAQEGRFADVADLLDGAPLARWEQAYADEQEDTVLHAEISRMAEVACRASELLASARLELGRPEEVVGLLCPFIDRHPFRERLVELLVLGLYRSGRQADALEAHRVCRERLVEGLGIEPGPALQRLATAVLMQDETVLVDSEVGPGPTRVDPELAPSSAALVGRTAFLTRLDEVVQPGSTTWVSGPGGVGKTHVLREHLRRRGGDFRHGVTALCLPRVPSGALVSTLAAALDLPGVEALRARLAREEHLLAIDEAEGRHGELIALLDELAVPDSRSAVVVTSRERAPRRSDTQMILPALARIDAVQLLGDAARIEGRLAPEMLDRLCERVGDLPLAIKVLGHRLRSTPAEVLLARLADPANDSGLADLADRLARATIDLLGPDEQMVLGVLSAFPGGMTWRQLADVGDDPPGATTLASLADHHVVRLVHDHSSASRYHLVGPIRHLAAGLVEEPIARRSLVVWARRALRTTPPDVGDGDVENLLAVVAAVAGSPTRDEVDVVVAIADHLARAGLSALVDSGVRRIRDQFASGPARVELTLALVDAAVKRRALAEARTELASLQGADLDHPRGRFLDAWVALFSGDHDRARALLRQRTPGDDAVVEVEVRLLQAQLEHRSGRSDIGATIAEEVAATARELDRPDVVIRALTRVATMSESTGRLERARAAIEDALRLARREGLAMYLPPLLGTSATIAINSGDLDEAEEHLLLALALSRQQHDEVSTGITLANLGELVSLQGRPAAAVEHLEAAVGIFDRVAPHTSQSTQVRINLADAVLLAYRDVARARVIADRALDDARALDVRLVAGALEILALADTVDEQYEAAVARLTAATVLREASGWPAQGRAAELHTTVADAATVLSAAERAAAGTRGRVLAASLSGKG